MRYPSMTALRALDAVARLGSVSEAATELNLTPSAISHQIKSLEQTLGFALTERTGRNIRITWQGERYARDIHGLLANILEAGQRFDGQQVSVAPASEVLSVGSNSTSNLRSPAMNASKSVTMYEPAA